MSQDDTVQCAICLNWEQLVYKEMLDFFLSLVKVYPLYQ